jgi:hypothetical protein
LGDLLTPAATIDLIKCPTIWCQASDSTESATDKDLAEALARIKPQIGPPLDFMEQDQIVPNVPSLWYNVRNNQPDLIAVCSTGATPKRKPTDTGTGTWLSLPSFKKRMPNPPQVDADGDMIMEPGDSSASAGLPSANIGKSMKGSSSFTDFIEPGQLPDAVDSAEVLG